MRQGEVYFAELDPVRGSEQQGTRPVVILQSDLVSRYIARTAVVAPFTSSQVEKYRKFPTCVFVPAGVGGLRSDSVALGHQIRTIDRSRLKQRLGSLPDEFLAELEQAIAFTLQILERSNDS